jgi:uncharacterized protein YuzE
MGGGVQARPIERYIVVPHAVIEARRRGIDLAVIRSILAEPEQRLTVRPGRVVLSRRSRSRSGRSRHGLSDDQAGQILEGRTMKVSYDARTDTLSLILRDGAVVAESDEDKPGVILDYDRDGNLVSFEILDASKRVTDTSRVEFQLAE